MSNSTLNSILEKKKWGTSSQLIHNDIFTGIEIELEGITYRTLSGSGVRGDDRFRNWSLVEDGSLHEGFELILTDPLKGYPLVESLHSLHSLINENGTFRNARVSQRCGVHIHLDARSLSAREIINLVKVYLLFERVVYSYVAPERYKNTFCRPLNNSEFRDVFRNITNNTNGLSDSDTLEKLIEYSDDGKLEKYCGLNLKPLSTFGSIEFRMHQGTKDIKSLINWINLLHTVYSIGVTVESEMLLSDYDTDKQKIIKLFEGTSIHLQEDSLDLSRGVRDLKRLVEYDKISRFCNDLRNSTVGDIQIDLLKTLTQTNKAIRKKS